MLCKLGFDLVLDSAAVGPAAGGDPRRRRAFFVHSPISRVRHGSFETAAQLAEAGIPFAIQTASKGYVPKTRVLFWKAAVAAAAAASGPRPREALEAVTLGAARILGVDDRLSSLEVGKDADLVLFDATPSSTPATRAA